MLDKINSVKTVVTQKHQAQNNTPKPIIQQEEINQGSQRVPVSSWQAYNSISFKGRPDNNEEKTVSQLVSEVYNLLSITANHETISVEDAIALLKPLKLNDKTLMQYLLGASFDNGKKEVVINKKAVLYAVMFNTDYDIPASKIPQALATLLDNQNMSFKEKDLPRIFAGNRFKKYSANLKPLRTLSGKTEQGSMKAIALYHKQFLQEAIQKANSDCSVLKDDISYSEADIFKPLAANKSEIISHITKAYEDKSICENLYKKLCEEINNDNFDIKAIYNDYYSLLNECTTLDEVHELYPELPIPFDKINEKPGVDSPRALNSRFAKEDWNKIGLDILKRIYLDFESPFNMMVNLEHSYPTTYMSMLKGNYGFGTLPEDIKIAQNIGIKLLSKFKDFDELSNKELEFLVKKNASKKSRVWAEYIGVTNKYWTRTRAIMHKLHNPDTTYYQTDKLVDGYLFNLYKNNTTFSESNPLSKYVDGNAFNSEKKSALENIYRMYKNNYEAEINSPEFQEFKKQYDVEGMKESLTQLEKHYKNTFFNWFYTPERKAKYSKAVDESYNMILEKLQLCDKAKEIELVDVQKVINDEISNEELADFMFEEDMKDEQARNDFNKCGKLILLSDNAELKELYNNYVGNDVSNRNSDYYQVLVDNMGDALETGKIDNPEKIIVMLKLHSEYINYVLNNNALDMDEERFTNNILKEFADADGQVDYSKANEYLKAKAEIEVLEHLDQGEDYKTYVQIINSKFLSQDSKNYTSAKMLLDLYINTPDCFKSELCKIAINTDKINNDNFINNIVEFTDKVSVWNIDNDEIITMDADKLPQQVVITSRAKKAVLGACNGNLDRFDTVIRKFYNAATQRTSQKGGQGVKVLTDNQKYEAELKILGSHSIGAFRLYANKLTDEDRQKYGNVKYVFDVLDEHL